MFTIATSFAVVTLRKDDISLLSSLRRTVVSSSVELALGELNILLACFVTFILQTSS